MNKLELLEQEIKSGGNVVVTVDSTNISTWAYSSSKVLTILFKKGVIYQYENVPKEVPLQLLNAQSIGKMFHTSIKNKYKFSRLNMDGSIAYTGV